MKRMKILSLLCVLSMSVICIGCGQIKKSENLSQSTPVSQQNLSDDVELPTKFTQTFSVKEAYSDNTKKVEIVGFKEYTKLKGKTYTDNPGKGNVYVVLFLEITNYNKKQDYINVNYLSTKFDGKETENTFLINDPEGYTSIFNTITPYETKSGFIAWKAPKNWKNLAFSFKGWENTEGLTLNCKLNHKDLFDPTPIQ